MIATPSFSPEEIRRMVDTRRDLHAHPEIAFEEKRTAALVAERLRALGLDARTGVGRTGVVATIGNESKEDADVMGQTVDLDANGTNADIGAVGNDLEIDSRRGSDALDLTDDLDPGNFGLDKTGDDVGLEATRNIYLSEVDAELRLVLAHAYTGEILQFLVH